MLPLLFVCLIKIVESLSLPSLLVSTTGLVFGTVASAPVSPIKKRYNSNLHIVGASERRTRQRSNSISFTPRQSPKLVVDCCFICAVHLLTTVGRNFGSNLLGSLPNLLHEMQYRFHLQHFKAKNVLHLQIDILPMT